MDKYIELLVEYSLILVKDNICYKSKLSGVKPMLNYMLEGYDVTDFKAYDRIVGKGAALLFVKAKIKEVYTKVISKAAYELLNKYNIKVTFLEMTPYIINRNKNGKCPVEQALENVFDIEEGYHKIISTLAKLGEKND